MKKITIAIDGFSSCGKSTLAKALAKKLDYAFIDTGAMYRATTLYFLRKKIDVNDEKQVKTALENILITFQSLGGKNTTFLNGENVEDEIRGAEVSNHVSQVAAISPVRRKMVDLQRQMGKNKGVVMDGRDIGTVVFPDAELKLFITADTKIRTQRRFDELKNKGKDVNFEDIQNNLLERDRIDSTRADSPLKKADDAIEIDNTHLTREQQLNLAMEWVKKV